MRLDEIGNEMVRFAQTQGRLLQGLCKESSHFDEESKFFKVVLQWLLAQHSNKSKQHEKQRSCFYFFLPLLLTKLNTALPFLSTAKRT